VIDELRAYHEAGHAVTAVLKGFTVTRVSIRRRGPEGGACDVHVHLRVRAQGGLTPKVSGEGIRFARAAAAVALGGSVAQDAAALERGYVTLDARIGRPFPLFSAGSDGDERAALAIARRLYRRVQEQREFLRRMRSTTERLLTSEGRWRAVRALATALLRARALDGKRVERIIGAALRPSGGPTEGSGGNTWHPRRSPR
jgi:hypothetical protein